MTLAATGMWETYKKIQYLYTLLCGEALHKSDFLSADVENTDTPLTVDDLLKGLA